MFSFIIVNEIYLIIIILGEVPTHTPNSRILNRYVDT